MSESSNAHAVVRSFATLLTATSRGKSDVKEFERLLVSCDNSATAALIRDQDVWRLLRDHLHNAETQNWDVMASLLNRLSQETQGRLQSLEQGFTSMLGEALSAKGKSVRGDKQIERLCSMACMVSLLSVEAPKEQVTPWCRRLCISVKESLERSQTKGSIMEAYTFLSVFIKLIYTSTSTPLATMIASTFISSTGDGIPLLLTVARKGLLEEQLTGAPKIVAEKSLVVLAKLNADAPDAWSVTQHLNTQALSDFLVRCVRSCSWVQSQDISLAFLARLIFKQQQIPVDFLDRSEVLDMLRQVLGHKSVGLKITGVAFVTLSPQSVFYPLAAEFEQAINTLVDSATKTLKIGMWEASRGIWGMDCELSGPATHAMKHSAFLYHAADTVPSSLPRCLWQLLPMETQRMVAASQGIRLPGDEDEEEEEEEEEEEDIGPGGYSFIAQPVKSSKAAQDAAPARPRGKADGAYAVPGAAGKQQANGARSEQQQRQDAAHSRGTSEPGGHSRAGSGGGAEAASNGRRQDMQQPQAAGSPEGSHGYDAAAEAGGADQGEEGADKWHRASLSVLSGGKPSPPVAAVKSGRKGRPKGRGDVNRENQAPGNAGGGGDPRAWAWAAGAAEAGVKRGGLSMDGSGVDPGERQLSNEASQLEPEAVLALQQLQEGGAAEEPLRRESSGHLGSGRRRATTPLADGLAELAAQLSRQEEEAGGGAAAAAVPSKRQRRTTSYAELAGQAPSRPPAQAAQHPAAARPSQQQRAADAHAPASRDMGQVPARSDAAASPSEAGPLYREACTFGTEEVQALNQMLDAIYGLRSSMGKRGQTLIKNMAEGAANIASIVFSRTYRLPPSACVGLDSRLATLKARAQLVYNGVLRNEPLDLLLPFSELISAESGIMRRNLEAAPAPR